MATIIALFITTKVVTTISKSTGINSDQPGKYSADPTLSKSAHQRRTGIQGHRCRNITAERKLG
jgi:hypothetical protein